MPKRKKIRKERKKKATKVISSKSSHLRELDLSNNDLQDSVKLLSAGLGSPHCRLETLGLSHCLVTEEACASLASALSSNPSHLRELDLSFNHPGDSGVKLLSAGLEDPHWRLKTLSVDHGGEHWINPNIITQYACRLTLDPNTSDSELSLSEDNRKVESKKLPDDSEEDKQRRQVLCREALTGRCYWEVEWSGLVDIAVTYRGAIRRDEGHGFGIDDKSWSLLCYRDRYRTLHNNKNTIISAPSSESDRVGVYLDWTLSNQQLSQRQRLSAIARKPRDAVSSLRRRWALHRGDAGLFTEETLGSSPRRRWALHRGDAGFFTEETLGSSMRRRWALHRGDAELFNEETLGSSQRRRWTLHRGDAGLFTEETLGSSQRRRWTLHRGDAGLFTEETLGASQRRQD
ncbi:uncharacterized protein ACJ7VT_016721 [Polymixia lowei]